MAGKPDRSAAADAAAEVLRDIGEWHAFQALLFDGAASPDALSLRFERENPVPSPPGLLGWAMGTDAASTVGNRPAERHARREGFVRREIAAHLVVCKSHACYRWLASRPRFVTAVRSLTAGKGDASRRELEFLRILSGALVQWAVMRHGTTVHRTADGAPLKLRLTRDDMRKAAELADQLRHALAGALELGSETAQGAYRLSHDLAARGRARSFRDLLSAVSSELREHADGADRVSPNNDTAADRALAVDLARRLVSSFQARHPAVVRGVCAAVGVTLTRTAIDEAIARGLDLPG